MGLERVALASRSLENGVSLLVGEAGDPGSDAPDLRQDLIVLWKTARLVLGEDHVAVDNDVKNPSTSADDFRFDANLALDGGCQTGSPG